MAFPGAILKRGDTGADVAKIQARLDALGLAVSSPKGTFDAALVSGIRLFQSLHSGPDGRPLLSDGQVGPMTWGALFPDEVAPTAPSVTSNLATAALGFAVSQIGVMEKPVGSNRGPEVDQYLIAAGSTPGNFWCMAFVFYCFRRAAADLQIQNPFPQTAGCLDAFARARRAGKVLLKADAIKDVSLVRPGMVFILDHGGGLGHTGFVKTCVGGALRTVEGNSNPTGSSNGIGVFELNRRNVANGELKGFITFT